MLSNVNFSSYLDAFNAMRPNQFSYEALQCLYDEAINIEEEHGVECHLDVIAVCCEWAEYESFEELQEDYSSYCESHRIETISDFAEHTQLFHLSNGRLLISQF